MLILITNDDGIDAPVLLPLKKALDIVADRIGDPPPKGVADYGTDIWAIENNLISVTPISLDMTAHRLLDDLKRWNWEDLAL